MRRAGNDHFPLVAATGVDRILMDIGMADMDGLEAVRQIREAAADPDAFRQGFRLRL